ncbi:MAG: hypothetical protein P8H89_01320 [Porticoccaceae bacterium]|mgnify:FL=1|nr:hypothetical protein [Porticoccaceae bacterium]
MKLFLKKLVLVLMATFVVGFWQMYFSERPELAIDPATLAGDGSLINYCEMPILNSQGKLAMDIPKGNTPGCAYDHFPLPVLSDCTEPLVNGADDIRGLWIGVEGKVGHVERVEQCGARTVITSSGVIHDGGPNSTAGENSNDTEGSVLFVIGNKDYCGRTSASMEWNNNVLEFDVFGFGPTVVRRYLRGDQLVWEYVDGSVTSMNRICQLPAEEITPKPRGPRYRLF